MISAIIFSILLVASAIFFTIHVKKIRRNILLGRDIDLSDNKSERLKTMLKVAFGQSKMVVRPVAGIMHFFIYAAFVITQIELLEIIIDGVSGGHRRLWHMLDGTALAGFYTFTINFIEILSVLAFIATITFLSRRNIIRIARFQMPELKGWPSKDANLILFMEIILITCIMTMNGADLVLQSRGETHQTASFLISSNLHGFFDSFSTPALHVIERIGWWGHILGIFGFLVYLPISKHLHILLAFPNTYYSNLKAKGQFTTLDSVTDVVAPNFDPAYQPKTDPNNPVRFGVKDVQDLTWKNLLDAYTCTECGRCTSACPQNITGKKLSPRKIMMDTRDRLTEVGKNIDANNGTFVDDGKSLLGDYITTEEIWACNTCNACVQECPVNINPLEIIVEMRRYLVMEQSQSPSELNNMFSNMENNGAPWQFSPADRANWVNEQ
jgi:heterodisulfide reductase subunit C